MALAQRVDLATPRINEDRPRAGESPERYVVRQSMAKAQDVALEADGAIVLGADTAVVIDGMVLLKPDGPRDAARMLRWLRGVIHRVVTGVAVLDVRSGRWLTSATSSEVTMRRYSDAEVAAYVASGEPFDKAGGYAVQDPVFRPAEAVEGCYLNVIGLPICEVIVLLERLGVTPRLKPDWRIPEECVSCPSRRFQEGNSG